LNFYEAINFKVLRNEQFDVKKNNDVIHLLGVENWGAPPFKQYGDLKKATIQINDSIFSVLMSHDPSHWEHEVKELTSIDLTLSGHTHGMQFGLEYGKWQWSPVKYKYPTWAGLYQHKEQLLYVNRGIGFIGYIGRFGILPEITVFELKREKNKIKVKN
jgi:uncharacterized protein